MSARNDATLRQIAAADPMASTWLSANAGSGKTTVLTSRVARLLLHGVSPQRILCLTYTKAAASEMQNRLFQRLGEWAMLPDADLRAALERLGEDSTLSPERLSHARTLFARAIETPGGLKIQTIHSFCAALLRRFPLEAGVSPAFSEMDDRAALLMRDEILQELADGPQKHVIENLVRICGVHDLGEVITQVCAQRTGLENAPTRNQVLAWFDLPAGYDRNTLLAQVFDGSEVRVLRESAALLNKIGTVTDKKLAAAMNEMVDRPTDLAQLRNMVSAFVTGPTTKEPNVSKFGRQGGAPGKKTAEDYADELANLAELMERVTEAREALISLELAEKTLSLHDFAQAFLPIYAEWKQHRGWLDFDDLIHKARRLLTDSALAQWVLYRLDGGIDHILVDEAQDTSPVQWQVIAQLAQEMSSGQGARADKPRTLFVVGDQKQSIYSFQGADPSEFVRMRAEFADKLAQGADQLRTMSLEYSFRSSVAVLAAVDQVFNATNGHGVGGEMLHRAFKSALPGRVDLWPVVEPATDPEPKDWFDPVDMLAPDHHRITLARMIAKQIKDMIENGSIPDQNGTFRRITPGDFLILVRGRQSGLFSNIIRACKNEGLDIAGSDRMKLAAELAVRDIRALLAFLSNDADDLSLATALRSPLFGWSEDELFRLAHGRGRRVLWQVMRERQEEHPRTFAILDDLRRHADFLRPYELIERILTRHRGRIRLIARLGVEAEDGIDLLSSQAMTYERSDIPDLTGFLAWIESETLVVKRQMDAAGDQIRVMTVHGSKGLESPIVIMPDTLVSQGKAKTGTIAMGPGQIVWNPPKAERTEALQQANQRAVDADEEERRRLLYVGMTRAEKWLIVCGAGKQDDSDDSWYSLVKAGISANSPIPVDTPAGEGLRVQHGDWLPANQGAPAETQTTPKTPAPTLPDWSTTPPPAPAVTQKTLSPSNLGGAKALAGEGGLSEEEALRRGRIIHRLLEHLPVFDASEWPATAETLLSFGEDIAAPHEISDFVAEATRVLNNPDLDFLFSGNGLSEVDITGALPEIGGRRILGVVDRLIIQGDRVLCIDFKTNAVVPETPDQVPDGLLRQMGAYAAALHQIYPSKQIEVGLLWTRTANLMMLPNKMVMSALADTALS